MCCRVVLVCFVVYICVLYILGIGYFGMKFFLFFEWSKGFFLLKSFYLFKIIISWEEVVNNVILKGYKNVVGINIFMVIG